MLRSASTSTYQFATWVSHNSYLKQQNSKWPRYHQKVYYHIFLTGGEMVVEGEKGRGEKEGEGERERGEDTQVKLHGMPVILTWHHVLCCHTMKFLSFGKWVFLLFWRIEFKFEQKALLLLANTNMARTKTCSLRQKHNLTESQITYVWQEKLLLSVLKRILCTYHFISSYCLSVFVFLEKNAKQSDWAWFWKHLAIK